jgi:hypothetical protein
MSPMVFPRVSGGAFEEAVVRVGHGLQSRAFGATARHPDPANPAVEDKLETQNGTLLDAKW